MSNLAPRSPLAFGLGVRQTKRIWFRHTALSRFGKCRKRGDLALDAAPFGCSPLVLHCWLATPPSASASYRAVVPVVPGSGPRHPSDCRRSRPTTQRRLHRVPAGPAPQLVPRLSQPARRQQCPARAGARGWHPFRPAPSVERQGSLRIGPT